MNGFEMKGLLYHCNARTNEEYKTELKKRKCLMLTFLLLGILTLITAIFFLIFQPETSENYTVAFFCGVGVGLILGGLMGIFKIRKTMNNEAALKEARLTETDEREQAISAKAVHMTLKIVLLSLYLLLLLCSFIPIEAITVLSLLIFIIFLSYLFSRKVYSKLM